MQFTRSPVMQAAEMASNALHSFHPLPFQTISPPQTLADRHHSFSLRWFFVADTLALISALVCAWAFAAACNAIFLNRYIMLYSIKEYGLVESLPMLAIMAFCLLRFYSTEHYRLRMPFWQEAKKIAENISIATILACFFLFAAKQDFSRLWLLCDWFLSIALILAFRSAIRKRVQKIGKWYIPALLIGGGDTARSTIHALQCEPSLGYRIHARIETLPATFLAAGHSWRELCSLLEVQYIIIALDNNEVAAATPALKELMRESFPFSISPPVSQLPVTGMTPRYIINHDVVLLTRTQGLHRTSSRLIKRSCDIFLSTVLLLVLSPVFLLISALVGISGGNVFFSHPRIGRYGRAFSCIKFRSMINDSEAVLHEHLKTYPAAKLEWEKSHKLRHDPRITRIGALLRRTSMDELPQLINVLLGNMSLVGPRPIVASEIEKYEGDIRYYHSVRPGITGLWQVSGRNDTNYDQRVHMDSWYVRNWSLWHDITIVLKTIPALVKAKGAY